MGSKGFLIPLIPVALVVGAVEFLVLPLTSGFVPFTLIVGGLMFVTGVLIRHKKLASFAGPAFIYVTLLLSPSNPEQFDLATFIDTFLQVFMSVVFTLLAFLLILPVSPRRRLYRVVVAVGREMQRSLRSRGTHDPAVAQARLYDRLVRALTFLGRPTGARKALLSDLYGMGAADIALSRAQTGLDGIADVAARPAIDRAWVALDHKDFDGMIAAARGVAGCARAVAGGTGAASRVGAGDLAYQEGPNHRVSRFYRLMMH